MTVGNAAQPSQTIETIRTPLGNVVAVSEGGRLRALDFLVRSAPPAPEGSPVRKALDAYFDGDLWALDTLGVDLDGTPFQRAVWEAIREVGPGETASYSEIAGAVGRPTAVRAVGTATGHNPVWLVVPCHRIVRADGSVGKYGGGEHRKHWLLAHEGVLPSPGAARI
jgi:methylated-DNA-[protein]-cysteine S-methyltransferase